MAHPGVVSTRTSHNPNCTWDKILSLGRSPFHAARSASPPLRRIAERAPKTEDAKPARSNHGRSCKNRTPGSPGSPHRDPKLDVLAGHGAFACHQPGCPLLACWLLVD